MNPLSMVVVGVLSVLYVWFLYNIPILVAGLRHLRRSNRMRRRLPPLSKERLPTVSIIVPAKDDEGLWDDF